MICPSCKKREATIHITQNVNGKTTRIDLCPVCAKEQGYLGEPDEVAGIFGGDLFGGAGTNLFKMAGGMPGVSSATHEGERCAYCGTSFEEFRNRGLLGCCHCYDEFGQRLLPVIRRIQAGEVHTGRRPAGAPVADAKPVEDKKHLLKRPVRIPKKKPEETVAPAPPVPVASAPVTVAPTAAPSSATELEVLRREQAEAVKAEDYEKAARIRDRIRALETGKEGGAKA